MGSRDLKTRALDEALAWIVPLAGADEGRVFPIADGAHVVKRHARIEVLATPPDDPAFVAVFRRGDGAWSYEVVRLPDSAAKPRGKRRIADGDPVDVGDLRVVFKAL